MTNQPMTDSSEGITWGPLAAVVVTITGFFAAQFIGAFLLLLVAVTVGHQSLEGLRTDDALLKTTAYVFLGNIFISFIMMLSVVWFIRSRRGSLRAIGLKSFRLSDVGNALLGCAIYFVIFIAMNAIIQARAPHLLEQRQNIGFDRETTGPALVPIFISLVLLPPLVEEILFRGFLYNGLKKHLRVIGATLITTVMFASAHLLGGETNALLWIAAIDTFMLSIILCYLREKTGRLWSPMIVHAIKNLVAFLALFIFAAH